MLGRASQAHSWPRAPREEGGVQSSITPPCSPARGPVAGAPRALGVVSRSRPNTFLCQRVLPLSVTLTAATQTQSFSPAQGTDSWALSSGKNSAPWRTVATTILSFPQVTAFSSLFSRHWTVSWDRCYDPPVKQRPASLSRGQAIGGPLPETRRSRGCPPPISLCGRRHYVWKSLHFAGRRLRKRPCPDKGDDNVLAVGTPMQKWFWKSHSKWKMVVRCFKRRAKNVDF